VKRYLECLVIVVLLCGITAIRGQDDAAGIKPKEEPELQKIKVETNLMEVRVVVTDKKGQNIESLKKEDFELFENDQPQEVSFFSLSQLEGDRSKSAAAETGTQDKDASLQKARERLSRPPVRTTLLFVDSLHLSFSSLNSVKNALRKFVKEKMTEQDVVSLVTTSQTFGAAQLFTRDKELLNYAIERIRLGPVAHESMLTPILASEVLSDRIDAVRQAVDIMRHEKNIECGCDNLRMLARNEAAGVISEAAYSRKATLSILRDYAEYMERLPGKRMIVVFSDGFTMRDSDMVATHMEQLQPAIDRAVRSGVVIYSIDAKGVASLPTVDAGRNTKRSMPDTYKRDADLAARAAGMDADAVGREQAEISACRDAPYCPQDPSYCDPRCFFPATGQLETYLHLSEREEQNGLAAMADQTGGSMYANHNELIIPLAQAFDANRFYYVLSYYLPKGSDPHKFRSIKVRVRNHPEYVVRTARGYSIPDTAETLAAEAAKTPQQRLIKAMGAPFPLTDLGVSAQADFMQGEADDKQVSLAVYFDGDRFQYLEKDLRKVIGLEILYAVYDSSGKQVNAISANVEGKLTQEGMAQAKTRGFRFAQRLALKPGVYQMRVGVREEGTDRMGTAATWIEVPEIAGSKLEMSSLVLRNPLDLEPGAKEGINVSELEQIKVVQGIPLFARSDFCEYSFRVHPGSQPSVDSDLQWMSELSRDGKPVKQEPWRSIPSEDRNVDGKGWFDLDGELDLSKFAPGVYELHISVKDAKSNKSVQRTAVFDVE
jgi:VWFA-related protein